MSPRAGRASGRSDAVLVILAAAFLAVALGVLWHVVATSAASEAAAPTTTASDTDTDTGTDAQTEARTFSECSWAELSEMSRLIGQAPSDEEGIALARDLGLVDEDGNIVDQTRDVRLANGLRAEVRIVGIRHDTSAADGSVRGLTLMLSTLGAEPMREDGSTGGWEDSSLRAWLADEGMGLLPEDLASVIVPVSKLTNNQGLTRDPDSVTATSDALWPFSAREVCGELSWFSDEYGGERVGGISSATYDAVLNAEGEQYGYFAQRGVSGTSDPEGTLALLLGEQPTSWWYRTPYPYEFSEGTSASYFYQVMSSGFPSSVGTAQSTSGVVVGFCL